MNGCPDIIVQLWNSNLWRKSVIKYYFSSWQTFVSGMELLPCKYTFKYSDNTQKQITIEAGKVNYI